MRIQSHNFHNTRRQGCAHERERLSREALTRGQHEPLSNATGACERHCHGSFSVSFGYSSKNSREFQRGSALKSNKRFELIVPTNLFFPCLIPQCGTITYSGANNDGGDGGGGGGGDNVACETRNRMAI